MHIYSARCICVKPFEIKAFCFYKLIVIVSAQKSLSPINWCWLTSRTQCDHAHRKSFQLFAHAAYVLHILLYNKIYQSYGPAHEHTCARTCLWWIHMKIKIPVSNLFHSSDSIVAQHKWNVDVAAFINSARLLLNFHCFSKIWMGSIYRSMYDKFWSINAINIHRREDHSWSLSN